MILLKSKDGKRGEADMNEAAGQEEVVKERRKYKKGGSERGTESQEEREIGKHGEDTSR